MVVANAGLFSSVDLEIRNFYSLREMIKTNYIYKKIFVQNFYIKPVILNKDCHKIAFLNLYKVRILGLMKMFSNKSI